jgi:hypothetical protein
MQESIAKSERPEERNRLSATKDGLEVARQLLIVLILLVFFIWPTLIKRSLVALGVNKLNVAGAEIDLTQTQKAAEKTGDATQTLGEANKTINNLPGQLKGLASKVTDPEAKKELNELEKQTTAYLQTTRNVEQDLRQSLNLQNSIIQTARTQENQDAGAWGIVISADKTIGEAQHEADAAKKDGSTVRIYERQGWLRTVVEFSSLDEAQAALPKLRASHSSSYLVNMTKWCPTRNEVNGVLQCPVS